LPPPPLALLIEATDVAVKVAEAVAPEPLPPEILAQGADA